MFGSKFFNETKESHLGMKINTDLKKEMEKINENLNLNVEDLDKPIVFDIVKKEK